MRLILLLLAAITAIHHAWSDATEKPNIVLILADDLGYGDLGCYGHPIAKTPHLDKLARQGVRMTQHYSNGPECSPTRTAFLTGRYQQRVGGLECAIGTGNVGRYDDAIRLANQRQLGLPADNAVIPRELNNNGYTCAVFGKWHLGYEPQFNPIEHGWSEFAGYLGGNVHYFNHRETSDLHVLFRGRMPVYREGYMTRMITDDSIEFIRRQTSPFFLYVSHECPHFPYQGPQDIEKVVTAENWMEKDAATYVAMLEDLDAEVGRIVATLDERGIAEETLLIFVSDNGGVDGAAHMGPLRGAKGTTLEGGIRVPLVARWPGKIKAGMVSRQVSVTFDLTRSFLRLAGAEVSEEMLDGFDIIDHLVQGKPDFDRTLFWRGKRGDRVWSAVRQGDMKFVQKTQAGQRESWLYDLASDVGEANDLSKSQSDLLKGLQSQLDEWEDEVKPSR